MQISTLLISLLLWTSHVSALPLDAAPTLDEGLAVITSTIDAAAASSLMTGTPRVPIDTDMQPIDGSSYFYVQKNCYQNTKVRDGFPNRGKFYETAYKDAVAIADAARKWPQLGTDASDKYVHQNLENSQYAPGIIANIKAAAVELHSVARGYATPQLYHGTAYPTQPITLLSPTSQTTHDSQRRIPVIPYGYI